MTSGIYCIENKTNGKKYIGSSDDIEERWYYHRTKLKNKTHDNEHLQRSYNKYGIDNFEYYIVEKCSMKKLEEREDYYIELYNTTTDKFGYNKKWAFGRKKNNSPKRKNRPMLDSIKQKLSDALKGRPKSEEWKEKVRKPKSEDWKRKIGDRHLFKKLNINRSSEYVGVYRHTSGKWIANIRVKGKKIYLGIYDEEREAATVFDNAYRKYYNKKFGLNFPNGI